MLITLHVLEYKTGLFWSPAMSYLGCKDTDILVNPGFFSDNTNIDI